MNSRARRRYRSISLTYSGRRYRRFAASIVVATLAAVAPTIGVDAAGGWSAEAPVPGGACPGGNAVARGGDGRIYSFCGSASAAYNPATNTWTAFRPDPISRGAFAVAAGKNGAILVVGGCCDGTGSALNAAEFYSPHTNTWRAVAPMPTPRMSLALSFASGKFYALGGSDNVGNVTDEVDAFNPSTNRWSVVAPLPGTGQCELGAVTGRDGRIYAIGGITFNCNSEPGWEGLNTVDAYAPATNTWTSVANLPADHGYVGRSAFGVTLGSDGRIYVIGGTEGSDCCAPGNRETPTALRYTVATNTWAYIAPLPTTGPLYYPPAAATSAGTSGKVYLFGGSSSAAAVYKHTP
jgi:N-acetylneuraminic acid mutarotase